MPRFTYHSVLLLLLMQVLLTTGCDRATPAADPAYLQEIHQWQETRLASLKKPTGWLSLAGLFWLKEGNNTFGSGKDCDLVFPEESAPEKIGRFVLENGEVMVYINPAVEVYYDGVPVNEMKVFAPEIKTPVILTHNSLSWFVIQRGSEIGVRLRDANNPAIAALTHIETYPIDPQWRVSATLEPYDPPRKILIENILGMKTEEPCPGKLVFELGGQSHTLDAVEEGDELFIIFSDRTNGRETYGAGRYLYTAKPGEDGTVILDFNKAYNPPCAYTAYATCPLPPSQNRLSLAVIAGEKYSGEGH